MWAGCSNGPGWAHCCWTCSRGRGTNRANVFDIELLARRLSSATDWLATQRDTASCTIGYFGASTGAGAALRPPPTDRPDRRRRLPRRAPRSGRSAALRRQGADAAHRGQRRRRGPGAQPQGEVHDALPNQLAVVQGATHLFEEPGTLAAAAILARDWFFDYLLPA